MATEFLFRGEIKYKCGLVEALIDSNLQKALYSSCVPDISLFLNMNYYYKVADTSLNSHGVLGFWGFGVLGLGFRV